MGARGTVGYRCNFLFIKYSISVGENIQSSLWIITCPRIGLSECPLRPVYEVQPRDDGRDFAFFFGICSEIEHFCRILSSVIYFLLTYLCIREWYICKVVSIAS